VELAGLPWHQGMSKPSDWALVAIFILSPLALVIVTGMLLGYEARKAKKPGRHRRGQD